MVKRSGKNQEEKRKTVLIVDDNPSTIQLLLEFLRMEGYAVVSARDAESGWKEYKRVKPDLVLTDMIMPSEENWREAGLDLLGRIRNEDSSTPVIVYSLYSVHEVMLKAIKLGADDYIDKMVFASQMLPRLKEVLRRNPLESEVHRLRKLASHLAAENRRVEEGREKLDRNKKRRSQGNDAGKYKPILSTAVHTLKGELMHIGHSIEEVRELASSSPAIIEECDVMDRSVAYSQILLRRLFDYIGMGRPSVVTVNTFEVLQKTESLVRPRLPSNIQLEVEIDQSMEKRLVSANDEQLMEVMIELIQNAVNVLREKGGTIELKLGEKDDWITISIKDNGPGIPRELRKELFKKQVKSKSGLGLGLFLCNKVVTEFGGKLDLRTSSKKGTTFTMLLPKVRDKKES